MPENKHADLFRAFADKIAKNDEKDFAGAFFVITPSGEPIHGILVGEPDNASFFGMIKTKLDTVITRLDFETKKNQAFGR